MADEVVNRLGFDVSQALEALARLDTALKGIGGSLAGFGSALAAWSTKGATAVSVMRDLASAAQRTATAMAKMATPAATTAPTSQLWLPPGVQSSAQQAATAMTTVGTAAQEAGQKAATAMTQAGQATNQAAEHTKGLTISWQTLARVVMTQLIVRTISMIRDALKEAVTASLEFQVQIAEIQTIAPRFGENFASSMATSRESLTREVAEFSKAFNIPLPKVAEGLYQTISNQFTKITDRMNVMNAAAALSKVGVMDFDKAILLLTGTLNAYGMASSQADTIAVKFYETIRLGRIRGEELAATYGQVAPIARELGVSINELNAAVVSMTIGGLDAHKTMTALRGVMMAFLKPSEELKRVTHGMGFTDPTQLIAAKGLQGAIQAISDAADGMGVKIAESVRNVRAILAELRLSSAEGAKKYQEALKAMDEATPENLAKILAEFRSTDAEKLTASINRLKVALTQDFGSILVKSLGDIMKFVGGAEQMAAVLTGIAAAAGAAVVAIAAISVALVALHFAAGPAGIALLAVGAIVAGIAGGVGLSAYTDMFAIGKIRKDAEAARKIIFDAMKQQQADIATWRTAADAENQATVADWQTRASGC